MMPQSLILIEALFLWSAFEASSIGANNQLFFIQLWGLFNNTGIDKGRSLKIYSYLAFIMRYQLTSFNII